MGSYIFYHHMVTHYITFHCMIVGVITVSFKMNKAMWYNSESDAAYAGKRWWEGMAVRHVGEQEMPYGKNQLCEVHLGGSTLTFIISNFKVYVSACVYMCVYTCTYI